MSTAQQPSQTQTSAPQPPPSSASGPPIDIPGLPQGSSGDLATQIQLGQLSQEQLLTLFKSLPSMVSNRTIFPESSKEAAETLSGLARTSASTSFLYPYNFLMHLKKI
ncbi:hypothetical protein EWM64_g6368 [Hericium alpestre]|uniref:Uncharacterized protein n=1 Tax=Hericium alpestre TaxID=135208 RepID=A0A4Y9ZS05_9AGAM|nr:hypothetical protein EWM64_g6368 [Hericium alpestre]